MLSSLLGDAVSAARKILRKRWGGNSRVVSLQCHTDRPWEDRGGSVWSRRSSGQLMFIPQRLQWPPWASVRLWGLGAGRGQLAPVCAGARSRPGCLGDLTVFSGLPCAPSSPAIAPPGTPGLRWPKCLSRSREVSQPQAAADGASECQQQRLYLWALGQQGSRGQGHFPAGSTGPGRPGRG